MQQIDRSYYGSRLCCWMCVEIITGKVMTPHKISRMFYHGRFHTISVDNGPTFTDFCLSQLYLYRINLSMMHKNTGIYCTGRQFIHVRCQVQL